MPRRMINIASKMSTLCSDEAEAREEVSQRSETSPCVADSSSSLDCRLFISRISSTEFKSREVEVEELHRDDSGSWSMSLGGLTNAARGTSQAAKAKLNNEIVVANAVLKQARSALALPLNELTMLVTGHWCKIVNV